jgi:hypothetical protein
VSYPARSFFPETNRGGKRMRIDCDDCQMQGTHNCDDCLVTALLHPPEGTVEIPDELGSSIGALSEEGLVPVLRFRPRDDAATDERVEKPPGEESQSA